VYDYKYMRNLDDLLKMEAVSPTDDLTLLADCGASHARRHYSLVTAVSTTTLTCTIVLCFAISFMIIISYVTKVTSV